MKRVFAIVLVCVLLLVAVTSNAEIRRFVDEETGVSFDIPEGWVEVPNSDGNKAIKAQYMAGDYKGQTTIAFAVLDLYSAMGLTENVVARKDMDLSYLDDEFIATMLGPLEPKTKEIKQYGEYQYLVITYLMERAYAGINVTFDGEMAVTLANGFVLFFQYMALSNYDEDLFIFEKLLDSVWIGTWICSECGTENNSKYCKICDKRIEDLRVLNGDGTYTYSIAESNMKIKLPVDWYYADRNIRNDDLFAQYVKLSAAEVRNRFLGDSGILFAYDQKRNIKLSIDAWEDTETDFRFLNDMGIIAAGAVFSDRFIEQGIEVKETTTIQKDYPYYKIISMEDGYVYTYITRIDGMQYVIQAVTGTLFPATEEKMIDNIILKISYGDDTESEPIYPPESGVDISSCSMNKFGSDYSIKFALTCEGNPKVYKTVTIEYYFTKDGSSASSEKMYKSIDFDSNDNGRYKYAYESVTFDVDVQGLFARICEIELSDGTKIDLRDDREFVLYGS